MTVDGNEIVLCSGERRLVVTEQIVLKPRETASKTQTQWESPAIRELASWLKTSFSDTQLTMILMRIDPTFGRHSASLNKEDTVRRIIETAARDHSESGQDSSRDAYIKARVKSFTYNLRPPPSHTRSGHTRGRVTVCVNCGQRRRASGSAYCSQCR